MALRPRPLPPAPQEITDAIAYLCPEGNPLLVLRDLCAASFTDETFADADAAAGRPARAPVQLFLVCCMQCMSHYRDARAVEAIRCEPPWRYVPGLRPGEDAITPSTLSVFRERLVVTDLGRTLLDDFLATLRDRDLLRAGGRQRTDSTAVYAAIRRLNRAELVGETRRATLDALAVVAPAWLTQVAEAAWGSRYRRRIEGDRLPQDTAGQAAWMREGAADGERLLDAVTSPAAPAVLGALPQVQVLRQVWDQQFETAATPIQVRAVAALAPASELLVSPYDTDARFRCKREEEWCGTLLHITETCDPDRPNVITDVREVPATDADVAHLIAVQDHLAASGVSPQDHLVDGAYVSAEHLARSADGRAPRLVGPVPQDTTAQAWAGAGDAKADFTVDWERRVVRCPHGHESRPWPEPTPHQPTVTAVFPRQRCQACPARTASTDAKTGRTIKLRSQAAEAALRAARGEQQREAWHQESAGRAGIEGTFSARERRYGMPHARYRGRPKTFLQHIITAIAMNVERIDQWMRGEPRAATRHSPFARLATQASRC